MSSRLRDVDEIGGLDEGIKPYVKILLEYGIETFESCQGGEGHSFPNPTIRFHGPIQQGWRALAAAMERGLPVTDLRYCWCMNDGLPDGPFWEIVFKRPAS